MLLLLLLLVFFSYVKRSFLGVNCHTDDDWNLTVVYSVTRLIPMVGLK
jgi:hypothetical protein